ncbi:MAG: DUF4912 domain-containing protein [Spirochaetaceae bacterium]|nr:DUF4912 domain-containing protein [Spirochaetaceae bacterium]
MDEIRVSHPYLEGLTTGELYELAQSFNIDLASGLDRNNIIDELVEFAPCLRFYQKEFIEEPLKFHDPLPLKIKTQLELPEPAPLPRQYNITSIDALIRDPFWVFVIWEVSSADQKKLEKTAGFESYMLRVRLNCAETTETAFVHTARVCECESARYLNFPAGTPCNKPCAMHNCSFVVELCAVYDAEYELLAASYPFTLPKSMPAFGSPEEALLHTPLLLLSGIDELNLVRGAL